MGGDLSEVGKSVSSRVLGGRIRRRSMYVGRAGCGGRGCAGESVVGAAMVGVILMAPRLRVGRQIMGIWW